MLNGGILFHNKKPLSIERILPEKVGKFKSNLHWLLLMLVMPIRQVR